MRSGPRAILMIIGGATSGLLAVVAVLAIIGHGWTAEVRLDCGDLRYSYLGLPVIANPMPEPERSVLISLADESLVLHPEWRVCAVFPRRGPVESDQRCRDAYRRISAWAEADRTIARLAMEDLAEYIDATGGWLGAPECAMILGPDVIDSTAGDVLPNWRSNPNVRAFCEARGYAFADEPAASQPQSQPASQPAGVP